MSSTNNAPTPMVSKDQAADWIFMFKLNATFHDKREDQKTDKEGIFGGTFKDYHQRFSQHYVYASSVNPKLVQGAGELGTSLDDPLGATFAQIYQNDYYYVLWNDQFYKHPIPNGNSPWGHSKGALAWNEKGEGMVLQVSTPSWPGSGSHKHPRQGDGNTLGTINDDDIEVSQHFFALKLNPDDTKIILEGLQNASVRTKKNVDSIWNNGGPKDIQALVNKLGRRSKSIKTQLSTLSSGVKFISKPSNLPVPPWQLVSAQLGALPLRVASWWSRPEIPSTGQNAHISCWASGLGEPGPVQIATSGSWNNKSFDLTGGASKNHNHAKLGVSMDPKKAICIFGDMNQQGALRPNEVYPQQSCRSSQNGRGGTFFVLENQSLFESMTAMLKGESAPIGDMPKK